jgi:hypothetical protein
MFHRAFRLPVLFAVLLLAAAAALAVTHSSSGTEEPPRAIAFPGPGWGHASPKSTITFRGATVDELEGLRVTGSETGRHEGTLHPLRLGRGAVFTPSRSFRPLERVEVQAPVKIRGAGGSTYSFRVARVMDVKWKNPEAPELVIKERSRPCRWRTRRLRTIPGRPPIRMCLRRLAGSGGSRKILISPRTPNDAKRTSPSLMILSSGGKLLWYQPRPGIAHDLKRQRFQGRPVLAFYQRIGRDYNALIDENYDEVARFYPGNGYKLNAHEVQLTPRNTAFIGIYVPLRLRSGFTVTEFIVQEVDVLTGDVLFEWHSLDHVPISHSYAVNRDGWYFDYFHGNSIEPPRPGGRTLLVSARKTSAVYGIDSVTGKLEWILGGRADQFRIDRRPGWRFCAQHDARWLPNGDISIFDNGGQGLGDKVECPVHDARAQQFRLDTRAKRARLIRNVWSGPSSDGGRGYRPRAVGSARREPNGDYLVSWGNTGRITQVSRRGRVRFKLQLAHWTYRAVRARWRGRPGGRPAVAAIRKGAETRVWASWNGATHIHRWQVLAGPDADSLTPLGRPFRFADLETKMRLRSRAQFVAVQALTRNGAVVGRSNPVRVG